ncbi:hypothetical protein CW304_02685 [Bacillus sp. UFRGS-B20]|nr:hypothetical protein CW304_02685 [Bacillus sp. UFRGS-B20]
MPMTLFNFKIVQVNACISTAYFLRQGDDNRLGRNKSSISNDSNKEHSQRYCVGCFLTNAKKE